MNTAMTKRQYSRRTGRNRMKPDARPFVERVEKYATNHPGVTICQMALAIKLKSSVIASVIIANHDRFAYTVDADHPDKCSCWTVEVRS